MLLWDSHQSSTQRACYLPSLNRYPFIHLGREEQVPCSRTQHVGKHGIWNHDLGTMSLELYCWATHASLYLKVAWSATVSCSDLLENDINCVYWQDNPTYQVSIFSKKPFWAAALFVIKNSHWLTVCKGFGTQPNFPYLLFFWKHD